MKELLVGMASGLLVSSLILAAAAMMAVRFSQELAQFSRRLPPGVSPLLVYLLVMVAIPPTGAILGGIFGVAYSLVERWLPGPGLGSPNLAFTLIVIGLSAPLGLLILGHRGRWELMAMELAFLAGFGWLLPWLAS